MSSLPNEPISFVGRVPSPGDRLLVVTIQRFNDVTFLQNEPIFAATY